MKTEVLKQMGGQDLPWKQETNWFVVCVSEGSLSQAGVYHKLRSV